MKKLKDHNQNYDSDRKFTKRKKSGWIKTGRNNDKSRLKQYMNISAKDLDSNDYLDEEENYR